MKNPVLIFPDTLKVAEYILNERLTKVKTNCVHRTLTGNLTLSQVEIAIKVYGAKLLKAPVK